MRWAFLSVFCVSPLFERILRITAVYRAIGPEIPTSAYLRAAK
jgi:hypothetical protein